jgi:hypothetical protein
MMPMLKMEKLATLQLFCASPTSLKKKLSLNMTILLRSEKVKLEAPPFQMEYITQILLLELCNSVC